MRDEFRVHKLNEHGLEAADRLADAFSTLLTEVDKLVPAGRERSLVVTKLQEASFWAKRGVATQPQNQWQDPGDAQ